MYASLGRFVVAGIVVVAAVVDGAGGDDVPVVVAAAALDSVVAPQTEAVAAHNFHNDHQKSLVAMHFPRCFLAIHGHFGSCLRC